VKFRLPSTAPDAGSVFKFVAPLLWGSKRLIAAAAVLAAVLAFALTTLNRTDIWSGRATLTIGLAPASEFLAQRSGPAIIPIETPRQTIARFSDSSFKDQILKRAAFDPATASVSRSMVPASLRGILPNSGRAVAIELSAGSAADVRAAFRAIATEIAAAHGAFLDRQIRILQTRIDGNKDRIAALEKRFGKPSDRLLNRPPPLEKIEPHSRVAPKPVTMISVWSDLHALVSSDTTLRQLSEPSLLRDEPDNIVVTHRSIEGLRASLLAGAGMLVAMIILTIAVSPPRQPPET
jgi:hypothetical protein